eukprot:scaffold4009_cov124-Cylindrotheca_fusiformis.AAC.10
MMTRLWMAVSYLGLLFSSVVSASPSEKDSDMIEKLLEQLGWEGQIGQMAQIDVNVLLSPDGSQLQQDLLDHYIGELGVGSVLNNVGKGEKIWKISDFRAASVQIQQTAKKSSIGLELGAQLVSGIRNVWRGSSCCRRNGKRSCRWNSIARNELITGTFSRGSLCQALGRWLVTAIMITLTSLCPINSYPMSRDGHDRAPSWIPLRHLYQYFVPPWKQVVGKVDTVMESYTEIDGVPNVANRYTLNRLLRQQLGFKGMLVTDYHEIFNLFGWHHTAKNRTDAIKQTMEEGSVDMSMIATDAEDFINGMEALDESQFHSRIEASARRVLELKQKLNMFEEAFFMESQSDDHGPTDEDLAEALRVTTESIILAQNNDAVLPLDPSAPLKVLVTGPTSRSRVFQSGGWTYEWQGIDSDEEDKWFTYGSTVYDAMKSGNWEVTYKCGVDIMGQDCEDDKDTESQQDSDKGVVDKLEGWVGLGDDDSSGLGIERAMIQAKTMDVIIVCIGEENYAEKPGDIRSLKLPTGQYDLVAGLRQAAPDAKIVAIYFGGRPRLLGEVSKYADAVLLGFLAGPLAGDALWNIVSGASNPSGKLPITYPKYEDGGGIPYLHAISDKCTADTGGPLPHWEYIPCEVEWRFGHGHSYSTFEYGRISANTQRLFFNRQAAEAPVLSISVTVSNKGSMAGSDAVMIFSFDEFRATTPEYKRLRGFKKIWLEPGDSTNVTLTVSLDDLRFVGPHDSSHYILQDGMTFQIGVGAHTDCRTDSNDVHCTDPITVDTGSEYVGACEAACSIWTKSGCDTHAGMTADSCWDMCTSIQNADGVSLNNDGWGWNYVACIESIVFEDSFEVGSCWKLSSLCRDVLATPSIDEFGNGRKPSFVDRFSINSVALVLALLSGVASSALIAYLMRSRKNRANGEEFGDVQFSQVNVDHEMVLT